MAEERPAITFIPMSTDADKIRFFGTLMPALLLLKASPWRFLRYHVEKRLTPRVDVATFVETGVDDAAQVDGTWIFIHRWRNSTFDPFAFANAKTFLAQVARLVRREGYTAEPLDPLSPALNLPELAARAGLGNLSPYGLLVHPAFGPRLIITGLHTDHPLVMSPRYSGPGCIDCMACVRECPQHPRETGVIELRQCQGCAICLAVCPVSEKGAWCSGPASAV